MAVGPPDLVLTRNILLCRRQNRQEFFRTRYSTPASRNSLRNRLPLPPSTAVISEHGGNGAGKLVTDLIYLLFFRPGLLWNSQICTSIRKIKTLPEPEGITIPGDGILSASAGRDCRKGLPAGLRQTIYTSQFTTELCCSQVLFLSRAMARAGFIFTPGPMVDETVTERRYWRFGSSRLDLD